MTWEIENIIESLEIHLVYDSYQLWCIDFYFFVCFFIVIMNKLQRLSKNMNLKLT